MRPQRIVLADDPDLRAHEALMQFRLTYDGPLRATRGVPTDRQRDPRASHKHQIRRSLHRQLRVLWQHNRFLRESKLNLDHWQERSGPIIGGGEYLPLVERLADQYSAHGYRFVPLVVEEFSLSCSIRILFLRREAPGHVIQSGDIDNRIKTLFDALRMPHNKAELEGHDTPGEGEDPFFVLLRDDSLISHAEITTDTWLEPVDGSNKDDVRLIIDVQIRPYFVSMFNLGYSG